MNKLKKKLSKVRLDLLYRDTSDAATIKKIKR